MDTPQVNLFSEGGNFVISIGKGKSITLTRDEISALHDKLNESVVGASSGSGMTKYNTSGDWSTQSSNNPGSSSNRN